jgi:uncharacterized protein YndB with AHSA1/START domain
MMSEKVKIELEFQLNTSPKILYNCLSTPSGLSDWFADNVNVKDGVYTFIWDGSEESAKLISKKPGESIKFQWTEDEGEDYFWEFCIKIDGITKGVTLIVTDHADEDEVDESTLLWNNQINNLKNTIGA